MDIQERLQTIWSQDYINDLPKSVKERGFVFSENNLAKDILITGFNPSFRNNDDINHHSFDFQHVLEDTKWDNYWSSLKKIIYDPLNKVDLRNKTAYLDIFYFREKDQNLFRKHILKSQGGIRFVIDQLNLTQHTIEETIKPKIIIVKNKESAAYWGKLANKDIIWMGYQLNHIQDLPCGELFKISGLIDSRERISPEISDTMLKDSLVLFTQHINQYTPNEKRPTASLINALLEKHIHPSIKIIEEDFTLNSH